MWLAPVSTGSALQGLYTNQTTFLLDTVDPTQAVIFGGWGADNGISDILLNGVSVGLNVLGFGALAPFSITNGYVHTVDDGLGNITSLTNFFALGINTLECIVSNAPSTGANPTAFRVELRGLAPPLKNTAPQIVAAPLPISAISMQRASFSVVAAGSGPLSYQWYRGPTLLSGQTQRKLVLNRVTAADAGNYTVVVTNPLGSINASATLTVTTPPSLAWLGSNGSAWDTFTLNWLNTGSSANAAFALGDDVLFDQRGSSQPMVDLTQPLTPNSITVNSASDYTFVSSTGVGAITGAAALTKQNTGTWILDVTNNSTADVLVLGGTLQVGNGGANGSLGSGAVGNQAAIVFNRYDTFPVPNAHLRLRQPLPWRQRHGGRQRTQ